MRAFDQGLQRKEIWRRFPGVSHTTIRQYHWLWKKQKAEENPMYATREMIRDFIKPAAKAKTKRKEEHAKKPTIKPERESIPKPTDSVISSSSVGLPAKETSREPSQTQEPPSNSPLRKQICNPFTD